jgi:hypothetical protein
MLPKLGLSIVLTYASYIVTSTREFTVPEQGYTLQA